MSSVKIMLAHFKVEKTYLEMENSFKQIGDNKPLM